MTAATAILPKLPYPTFRGIEVPVLGRDCRHSHVRVKKEAQYSGGKRIDITGSDCWVYEYVIPFRQGIAVGGFKDLFNKVYPEFLAAYLDKSRGPLLDPIHGEKQVKPGEWREVVDPDLQDGLNVAVTFEEDYDPDDEDEADIVTIDGAKSLAGVLDKEVEVVAMEEHWEPPESTADPLAQIAGLGAQLQRNRDAVTAKLEGTAYRCEQIEERLDDLEDPKRTQEPIRAARNLHVATVRLAKRNKDPVRVVKKHVVQTAIHASALARQLGMLLEDLLDLNPTLAGHPIVPEGFQVNYKAKPRGR